MPAATQSMRWYTSQLFPVLGSPAMIPSPPCTRNPGIMYGVSASSVANHSRRLRTSFFVWLLACSSRVMTASTPLFMVTRPLVSAMSVMMVVSRSPMGYFAACAAMRLMSVWGSGGLTRLRLRAVSAVRISSGFAPLLRRRHAYSKSDLSRLPSTITSSSSRTLLGVVSCVCRWSTHFEGSSAIG